MTDSDLTDLDRRVLAAMERRFPVSQSPYCDLGEELGASESDVLNSAVKLRKGGGVEAIVAVFAPQIDLADFEAPDAALASIASFDLPWSEHPYAEIAAELSLQGIDLDESWVIKRLNEWLEDGSVSRVTART